LELKNKKAIVTGSSGGIGAEIALQFAREGADIVINYNSNKDGAMATSRKIENIGRKCIVIHADVSKEDQAKMLIEESIKEFGNIDILVNNAGGGGVIPEGNFTEIPLDFWREQIDLNLYGAIYCSYYVLKNMLAK